MAKRTRVFFLITAGVLVAGLGTGLVASYMGFQGLTLIGGDGPDELAYIPQDARLVAFADVREVMNSEFRQKFRELHPQAAPNAQLEEQTGINIETDIDHIVAAVLAAGGRPLVLARGRFNETRIESLIREKGGRVEDYKTKRLLILPGESADFAALAFAEPGLAVFGTLAAVRLALDTRSGNQNVTDNAAIMTLVRDVDSDNAWAVGKFAALASDAKLPANMLQQLPAIDMFAASGHINGGIRATIRAEARDDAAAQNLREVVQGFVALARLQTGKNQQLQTLLNSVQLAGIGKSVQLTVSIPLTALDMLAAPKPRQQARAGF